MRHQQPLIRVTPAFVLMTEGAKMLNKALSILAIGMALGLANVAPAFAATGVIWGT